MKDLTRGPVAGHLWSLTAPLLLGNVFQQFYNMADAFVVGRFVGPEALAAVATSFPVVFLLAALLIGTAMGFSVLAGQFFGAKDLERLARTVDTGYGFGGLFALVVTFAGVWWTPDLVRLLRTPAEVVPSAVSYLRITFAGSLFFFGSNSLSAVLRGLGDARTPLALLVGSNLLNIGLDLLFVPLLGWGVAGAAWATVLSQAVSVAAGLAWCRRTGSPARLRLAAFRWDGLILRKALAIGAPTGVQQLLVAGGMMAIVSLVNGFGAAVAAGYAVASRLDAFAMLPAFSVSMALTAFTGQNIGAGRDDRVGAGLRTALVIIAVLSLPVSAFLLWRGRPMLGWFSSEPNVVEAGMGYFRVVAWFYAVFGAMFAFGGVLRGAGDVTVPMLLSVLSLWVVRVPLAVILARRIGAEGIWWSLPAAWVVGTLCLGGYYLTGRWRRVAAIRTFRAPQPMAV